MLPPGGLDEQISAASFRDVVVGAGYASGRSMTFVVDPWEGSASFQEIAGSVGAAPSSVSVGIGVA